MDKPSDGNFASFPGGETRGTTNIDKGEQSGASTLFNSLGKMAYSAVESASQQKSAHSLLAEHGVTVNPRKLLENSINPSKYLSEKSDGSGKDSLMLESAKSQKRSQASFHESGLPRDSPSQTRIDSFAASKEAIKTENLAAENKQFTMKQVKGSDASAGTLQATKERNINSLSHKIEKLSKEITLENYLEAPIFLVSEVSELWQSETLYVLGHLLDKFHSKQQWQCVIVTLVLLKNVSLSTDDLKSHKEVARKVYSLSRASNSSTGQEDSWFSHVVHLAKMIVTSWKKTVIEASKQEDGDLKLQTSKRSRSESEDPAKKKQKLVSKASNNQAESDVPKNHKSLQKPVTLSDDALFGTPIPNVSISKRQTSSKLPSLSVSASLSKGRTIEEAAPSVSDDTREICHPREEVSKHSSTTGTDSKPSVSIKRVQFAPPEKLVTVHEIENIEQLRQWEREEAGFSSGDVSSQGSSGTQWNETFEAHKKREREMEKSVFQAKSEHFVKAVREMKEEMDWRNPFPLLVEHVVAPGSGSVEKTSRERTVQMVPERYSDRNSFSPASPEHKSIELSPLQEIPLETIETPSQPAQQLSKHSNVNFKENQTASQQRSVNNVPSQSSIDNNNNVLQMLQQNPSVLQSLLSAFGASMTGSGTFTGAVQQSVNYGQQSNNRNNSAVQGFPSSSYSGTNMFSSGLSMLNIAPSSQSNIDPMLLQQLTQQSQGAALNQQAFQGPGAPFFSYAQANESSFMPSYFDAFNQQNAGNVSLESVDSYGSSQSIVNRSMDDKKTNASKKSNICYFYNQGTCANGDSCRFLHVKVPYKVPHPKTTKK